MAKLNPLFPGAPTWHRGGGPLRFTWYVFLRDVCFHTPKKEPATCPRFPSLASSSFISIPTRPAKAISNLGDDGPGPLMRFFLWICPIELRTFSWFASGWCWWYKIKWYMWYVVVKCTWSRWRMGSLIPRKCFTANTPLKSIMAFKRFRS